MPAAISGLMQGATAAADGYTLTTRSTSEVGPVDTFELIVLLGAGILGYAFR